MNFFKFRGTNLAEIPLIFSSFNDISFTIYAFLMFSGIDNAVVEIEVNVVTLVITVVYDELISPTQG